MVPYAWIVLDMIKPSGDIQIKLFLLYSQFHLRKSEDKHEMVNIKNKTNVYNTVETSSTVPTKSIHPIRLFYSIYLK